ncbi:BgtA-20117 [Blumeria graminis f. sp. tritici]|uniref:BgtA-20117 n=2 Tax=Blumeria graminis f. sp. tritici TaxID=62690 RepID=A0A9X9MJS1_BLUGR|nr:hypothetical protein BGT96224_A20117 [Blumeria graminis f. sp. tritici 96224]VDB89370.1 BgtA-20117 [Blumeria graminis f. sp. tritici]
MMEDSCSSPDPLNDTIQSPTKSQRSARSQSNHPTSNSPKKKTFHLDVGNHISPQKILVTVEAGDSDLENVYSRMNEVSPSPHRPNIWHKAVSKTIPLNDVSDNDAKPEPNTTPRKTKARSKKTGSARSGKKRVGTPYKRYKSYLAEDHLNDELFEREISPLEFGQDISKTGQNISQSNAARSKNGKRNTPSTKRLKKQADPVDNLAKYLDTPENDDIPNKSALKSRKSFLPASPMQQDSNLERALGSNPPKKTNLLSLSPLKFKPQIFRKDESNNPETYIGGKAEKKTKMGYGDSANPNSKAQINFYPSPSSSENHVGFKPQEMFPQTQQKQPNRQDLQNYNSEAKKNLQEEHDLDSEEEAVNTVRDTDTIVESEGFSMISFDSVLSFQGQPSSSKRRRDMNSIVQTTSARKIARHRYDQEDITSDTRKKSQKEYSPNDEAYDNRSFRKKNNLENGSSSDRLLRYHNQAPLINYLQGSKSPVENSQHTNNLNSSKAYELSHGNMFNEESGKKPTVSASNPNVLYEDSFSAVPSCILNASKPSAPELAEKQQLSKTPGDKTNFPINQDASNSEMKLSLYERLSASDSQLQDSPGHGQTDLSQHHELTYAMAQKSNALPLDSDDYDFSSIQNTDIDHNQSPIHVTSENYSSPSLPMCTNQTGNQLLLVPPLVGHSQATTATKSLETGSKRTYFSSSPINESNRLGSPFTTPLQEQELFEISEENLSAVQDHRTGIYPRVDLNSQLSGRLNRSTDSASLIAHKSETPALTRTISKDKKSQEQESIKELTRIIPRNKVASNEVYSSDKKSSYLGRKRYNEVRNSYESNRPDSEIMIPQVIKDDTIMEANNIVTDENDEDFDLLLETLNSSTPSMEENRKHQILLIRRPEKMKVSIQDSENHSDSNDKDPTELETPNSNKLTTKFHNSTDKSLRQFRTSIIPRENISCLDTSPSSKLYSFEKEIPRFDLSRSMKESFIAQDPKSTEISSRSSKSPSRQAISPCVTKGAASQASSDKSIKYFEPIPQKQSFKPTTKTSLKLLKKPASKTCEIAAGSSKALPINSNSNADLSPSTCSPPLLKYSQHKTENSRLFYPPKLQNLHSLHKEGLSSSSQLAEKEICITHEKIGSPRKHRSGDLTENNDEVQVTCVGSPRSPIKSCIRSPRKISPGHCSKTKICTPVKVVKFISSSPIRSSPLYDRLSAVNWTKNHWLVLEKIVKCWKPEAKNRSFRTKNSSSCPDSYRNSTRVISDLLGRYIFSAQCERMKLEQWHLEAVDEFRTQVPGWDEKQVAMRVYALLAGEKARACMN